MIEYKKEVRKHYRVKDMNNPNDRRILTLFFNDMQLLNVFKK